MKSEILQSREALHKAIYNCTRCKDHGYPVVRVQPEWDSTKAHGAIHKWGMLIGQAPGIGELSRSIKVEKSETGNQRSNPSTDSGIAFRGNAGQRLRQWLGCAGFSDLQLRNLFYKTSVVKCFPGRNKSNRDRKPTKTEITLCSPFMKAQIRLVAPTVLIPMGKVAINWFFPQVRRLEEVIGKTCQWKVDDRDYTVICLPHSSPASGWWKAERNQPFLRSALQLLSELRQASSG